MEIISAYGRGIDALREPGKLKGSFGISADYPFFQERALDDYVREYLDSKRLREYFEWALGVFDDVLVYTPDTFLSYNLMAFEAMAPQKALEVSSSVGTIIEKECSRIISQLNTDRLRFYRQASLAYDTNLGEVMENVRSYSRTNIRFSNECLELTCAAVHNRLKIVKSMHGKQRYKEAVAVAQKYAVDDVALTLYLCKHQACVSFSKYEPVKPIKNFLYGKFPGLREILGLEPGKIGHVQAIVGQDDVYETWYDDRYEKLGEKK